IGFLTFEDPTRAIAAVAALSRLAEGFVKPRGAAARMETASALPAGPINEAEAKRVLALAGLSFAPEQVAGPRDEAGAAGKAIGCPVVPKVPSPDTAHKPEAGGVGLGLRTADEVASAYDAMMDRVRQHAPNARLEGALVARMIVGGVETVI